MNTSKFALLLLLLVGAAVGAFFLLQGEGGNELPPRPPIQPADITTTEYITPIRADTTVDPGAGRRDIMDDQLGTGAEYDQGVMGTVYGPSGNPVHGADVFLIEGATSNTFQRFQAVQEGVVFLPAASGKTDEQGQFALGLREAVPDRVFAVRILTDTYADYKIPNLTIQDDDWYEVPSIVLAAGTMVHGRVTLAGQGLPAPGAVVYIKAAGGFPDLTPIPGREQGLRVEVDESGYFQITNAPEGIVNISAVAPYFARMEKTEVNLDRLIPNEVNFELSRGQTIRGIVTDPTGGPVRGAVVLAMSLLPKQPQTEETRTGGDGRFEFLSLVEAPFQLTARARGFERHDEKPVQAGSDDVHLILERQGRARVKVFGRGRLLTPYVLSVKRHFVAQSQIGIVQNQSSRTIRGGDLDNGYATVGNLNAGAYVFEIDARGYARTFSDPFTVGPGRQPPELEVPMSLGGTISGTVVDASGRPAGGVVVQTQANGFNENGFGKLIFDMIPVKITEAVVRTDDQGRYRFAVMAKGTYQLKLTHPDLCALLVRDLVLAEGQTTEAPVVTMLQGARLTGTTMVNGLAAGQVKVLIQQRPSTPGAVGVGAFSAEAVSDSQGQFEIPRRLPPGTYQIQATRQPENPFMIFGDYEKTRQTFIVPQGHSEMRMNVNVPTG